MLSRLVCLVVCLVRAAFLSRLRPDDLAIENAALRQQVASLASKPHPRPDRFDRVFWAALSSLWPKWSSALAFVSPDTVVRWHRAGFRVLWRFKSRRPGRPPVDRELRDLIVRMATENPTWGAPRIHGELLKLGFTVAQATIASYMPARPRRGGLRSPTWRTFLWLHLSDSVGIDFFDIPTATFDVLHGFVVIDHERRELLHLGVTKHPTAEWTANQLPQAFPDDSTPEHLFRDRDGIFGAAFTKKVKALGIEEVISAPRSPWQNPFAERVVGTLRRELLDHVIVLNERHATRLLRDFQNNYYNPWRTHLGLAKDSPTKRSVQPPEAGSKIVSVPILGGLHHRYERRAA
jgi:putative transposase